MDMSEVNIVAGQNKDSDIKPKQNKNKQKKPVYKQRRDIVLKFDNKEYVFNQICIVTTHAPMVRVGLHTIDYKDAVKHESEVVNKGIVRLLKYEKVNQETSQKEIRYKVLSGYNKLQQFITDENALSIEAQLVSRNHLDRCLVPPKTLGVTELREKITSNAFVNAGFKVRVGKQKQREQVAP